MVIGVPNIHLSEPLKRESPEREYEIAISYASEDRPMAEKLAGLLRSDGVKVFFDQFETADLWGKDLYQHLHEVYSKQARFAIILISKYYVASHKRWTRHELKAAQVRQLENVSEYILPVRLDDSELPGLANTIAYLDLRELSLEVIASAVKAKLQSMGGDAI
jgi:hypothetical protein